jgi:hypothetical protein
MGQQATKYKFIRKVFSYGSKAKYTKPFNSQGLVWFIFLY